MTLKEIFPSVLIKKRCCIPNCNRNIIVARIDWEKRDDFVCDTCKTHRKKEIMEKLKR